MPGLATLGLAALTLAVCLRLYARVLIGRDRLDVPALVAALRLDGLTMLPAMTLVAVALGAILGQQSSALLNRLQLPDLFVVAIGYAVSVELMPLLVGILIAGRAGVALAARLATQAVTGEMDGLRVCGIDPIEFNVAPTLLAIPPLAVAFAVWGSLVSLGVVFGWLHLAAGVPLGLCLDGLGRALSGTALLQALAKPLLFALLIALLASANGLLAERDSGGIGRAATRTMIGAVMAILILDLLFALLF